MSSSTRIWSALATVDSRCAMINVVRPWRRASATSRGSWTVVDPAIARKAKKRLVRTVRPAEAVAAYRQAAARKSDLDRQADDRAKTGVFTGIWATNPVTQIRWGLGYIRDRYGSPCGAWGQSQSAGWY